MAPSRGVRGEVLEFRPWVIKGRPVVGDGAHGTYLDGGPWGVLAEAYNLEDPRQVEQMHLQYLAAGADVLQTNTYAANRLQLAGTSFARRVYEMNVAAAKLARSAREIAGKAVFVAGTIGPLTPLPDGRERLSAEEMTLAFREQVEALLAGGVDLFLIETQSEAREAAIAVREVRRASTLPVIVNFSFALGDRTLKGQTTDAVLRRFEELLREEGVAAPDLLGVNCGLGPEHVYQHVARIAELGWHGRLAAAPNAGPALRLAGRVDYPGSVEAFAKLGERFLALGVQFLAGCCGTTPAHIAALARLVKPEEAAETPSFPRPRRSMAVPAVEQREDRGLAAKLGRTFVISVELDPPRGPVPDKFLADAMLLKDAGVDAINVGDSPMARVRMSALAACHLIQSYTGVETILHFTTRDRNRMAIQADLLSAEALGVRTILALTGDRPRQGPNAAQGVYELDAVGLLEAIASLNAGRDLAGQPLGTPTHLVAGAALNPNAQDLSQELERLRQKLAAGARFVMTQPIYHLEPLYRVLDSFGTIPVPVLLGVMPIHSLNHGLYLNREVPGIEVPEAVLKDLAEAGDQALERGLLQSVSLVEQAAPLIAGVYVVLSFGKALPIADLVRRLKRRFGSEAGEARGRGER